MTEMMKAAVAMEPGRFVCVDDVPRPALQPHESLVRIRACGFCSGTDLKLIDDQLCDIRTTYPAIIGHEGTGEIVAVGEAVRNWKVGDRVTSPGFRLGPGSRYKPMWGHMSQYGLVADEPGVLTRRIPSDMSFFDAAVLLSLKEAYSAVGNFGFEPGMQVLVFGDGPMGLALVQFMRLAGADWLGCVGHWPERLERIGNVGKPDCLINSREERPADVLGSRRVDLVIDAVGTPEIIQEGARLVKQGGKVGVTGVPKPGHAMLDLLALPKQVSIQMLTFPMGEHDCHDAVVELIREGTVNPKDYYSHVVPIDRVDEAPALVRSREAFKVVIDLHPEQTAGER